jgi:hypothetical protein
VAHLSTWILVEQLLLTGIVYHGVSREDVKCKLDALSYNNTRSGTLTEFDQVGGEILGLDTVIKGYLNQIIE